jgi:hypothetical protein
MKLEWIADKGNSLLAFLVGLVFLALTYINSQYRYFLLCVAIVFLALGYKQIRKRDTPFERRERELRRKRL